MKVINRLLYFIVTVYSLYLVFTNPSGIYGTIIKLSVIPIILLPQIVEKIFHFKFNKSLQVIYVLFVFLAHFLGSIVDLYHKVYWYDSFTHFLSGIVIAFLATYLLIIFKKYDKKSIIFNILFILGISFIVAGLWEMFEFACDNLFNKDAQNVLTTGVDDTMKDMIVAALGTVLYCILYAYEECGNKFIIIKNFIKSI